MKITKSVRSIRTELSKEWPYKSIGFVPTMGALHEGHASLMRRSVKDNDLTVASIFVNPTQFGPNEDFSQYPRTFEQDCALLEKIGVDIVFAPLMTEIYPKKAHITFTVNQLADKLCGESRPGHFNGVLQIVSILFNIIQPNKAYFGLKDYQQYLLIRQLVSELFFPLEIVGCPIIREKDGLAMSSRNRYLNKEERRQALFLYNTLRAVQSQRSVLGSVEKAKNFVKVSLQQYPLVKLDYFEIFNGETLNPIDSLKIENAPRGFISAFLGKTRLIDNMSLVADTSQPSSDS